MSLCAKCKHLYLKVITGAGAALGAIMPHIFSLIQIMHLYWAIRPANCVLMSSTTCTENILHQFFPIQQQWTYYFQFNRYHFINTVTCCVSCRGITLLSIQLRPFKLLNLFKATRVLLQQMLKKIDQTETQLQHHQNKQLQALLLN